MLAKTNNSEKGFTVTELIVSITLIGIISVVVLTVVSNYLVIITRNNFMVDMTVSSQNLLRTTVEELRYGAGVQSTNTIDDPNADEPAGGWNTSNEAVVVIIAQPATDISRDYIIDNLTGQPYVNELVYYKRDSILYRRTLANPLASGNRAVTTCTPSTATATCPADRILNENLESMVFTLFNQDNAITTDPSAARALTINLELRKQTFGDPLTLTNSITVAFRNRF